MEPECIYFVFHHPATFAAVRSGEATLTQMFGHVEAMGYTMDDTWFFYDPARYRSTIRITHLHDEVEEIMAEKFSRAHTVIQLDPRGKFGWPIHFPMNCVTQCAALVGMRAFTPRGFRKRLLREKGVVIHGPERRSRSQEGPQERAAPVPD